MTEQAVTNSTCLIALERIGRLDILPSTFAAVVAPSAVQAEVGFTVPWLTVRSVRDPSVAAALRTQLDHGEAEVIALAMELGEASVILDDKKARRVARQLGLTVIGTIGVPLRGKRLRVISTVTPLLKELDEAGFRMTAELHLEALRLAGEDPQD